MRRKFKIPKIEEVLEYDRMLLYAIRQHIGFIPNLYAFMTRSETALKRYLDFKNVCTVFTPKEMEAIHLVTSQVNQCPYCLAAHTSVAKQLGLTDKQIEAIRKGKVVEDKKMSVLVDFTCELITNRGKMRPEMIEQFYGAGYTDASLVDLCMIVGMTTMTNYLNNATWIPVDFPEVPVIICSCGGKVENTAKLPP